MTAAKRFNASEKISRNFETSVQQECHDTGGDVADENQFPMMTAPIRRIASAKVMPAAMPPVPTTPSAPRPISFQRLTSSNQSFQTLGLQSSMSHSAR
nr:hypothetical protein [Rhizobium lusitanum]